MKQKITAYLSQLVQEDAERLGLDQDNFRTAPGLPEEENDAFVRQIMAMEGGQESELEDEADGTFRLVTHDNRVFLISITEPDSLPEPVSIQEILDRR